MSGDFSPELRKELLDDFYAECDELLMAVREGLTVLERSPAAGVEGLFRAVHSLKGIAAIAGVREAEELAHAMEDMLRALSEGDVALTAGRVGVLLDATRRLEQIIGAHQAGKPAPEHATLAKKLRAEGGAAKGKGGRKTRAAAAKETREETAAAMPAEDPVAAARAKGLQPWRCTFAPSAELDARGVNVNRVRERLSEVGEIFQATPVVRPGAGIAFVFVVGLRETPADRAAWAADGMTLEPVVEAAAGEASSLMPSHLVRVDLARLDDLMRIAGEMVIQRSRLEDRIRQQFGGNETLKEIDLGLARSLRELRKAIARVRLVPIAEIFTRMPFVIRDLAAGSDKKARVVLEGHQTEIDKYVAERLKEPLLHLVRNAFSHGIEAPAERVAAGKPEEATVTLRAESAGEFVTIQVRDDGGGIDAEAVVARAKVLGVSVPERRDAAGLLGILCAPGFSTREEADRAAGRGVGMAVVANTVRELGGTLTLETTRGGGTTFTLRLPLTLSIVDAIVVAVGGEICAVPQSAVDEIVQVTAGESRSIKETEVLPYRGGLLPVVRLRGAFGLEAAGGGVLTVLVVSGERGATGLVVDRVLSRREIVVRPLTDPLVRVPGVAGATELGDGRPILILDPNALTSGVVRPAGEYL